MERKGIAAARPGSGPTSLLCSLCHPSINSVFLSSYAAIAAMDAVLHGPASPLALIQRAK